MVPEGEKVSLHGQKFEIAEEYAKLLKVIEERDRFDENSMGIDVCFDAYAQCKSLCK